MPINKRRPAQAPNGENAYLHIHETEQEQEAYAKDMGRIGIAVAALGGLAGALLFGGGMFLLKKTGEDALEAGLSTPPSVSAPEVAGQVQGINPEIDSSSIDVSTYPHASFAELPFAVQLDKVIPVIEERIKNGAVDEYRDALKKINAFELEGGIGTGSIHDDPQEIQNRLSVKTNIYRSEENINLARNLVSSVYLEGTQMNEFEQDKIGNGKEKVPTTYHVFESSPVFIQGRFANIEASGTPTRVLMVHGNSTGKVSEIIVQEMRSHDDPNKTEVIVVGSVLEGENGFKENLATFSPQG